jgi:hypothetical protein
MKELLGAQASTTVFRELKKLLHRTSCAHRESIGSHSRRLAPVGEHLKYLVWARPRIARTAWSSAPRHLGSRDRHSLLSPRKVFRDQALRIFDIFE